MRARLKAFLYCPARAWRDGSPLLPALLLLVSGTKAHAASLTGTCQPSDSVLLCRLRSMLTVLEIAAVALALLLLVAILAALTAYRRKAQKPPLR